MKVMVIEIETYYKTNILIRLNVTWGVQQLIFEIMIHGKFRWKYMIQCHKVNLRCGGSYIDSQDWIKKTAINPKNKG